jgi:hypothetical protein
MMAMRDYLTEIEFAAGRLIPMVWEERTNLQTLEAELAELVRLVGQNYDRAADVAMNALDGEDVALATGMYWENYFGDDKARFHKDEDRKRLADQVAAHALSVSSIAAALLQFAKGGLSLAHGGFKNCPQGRALGGQFLKDVVWEGRNQAIHWEEGKPREATQRCFDSLSKDFGASFSEYRTRNMAMDIVAILGWTDFERFKADMLSLA